MTELIPLLALIVLLALNAPVAYAVTLSALSFFLLEGTLPTQLFVQRLISGTEAFPLLAIPFFILAGIVMNHAGVTNRIMALADVMSGHMIGGLARVNVLLSTMMGGMSGSANADAAMQSTILVPEMTKRGYDKAFSAAITAFSAIITAIIPPSIGLVLYGFLANVSVGRLFMAGIVPGIVVCSFLLFVVGRVSRSEGYPPSRDTRASWSERGNVFIQALWALMIPIGILGGIRIGWYTPTEAGAIAVVYSLFLGIVVYRSLSWRKFPTMLIEAAISTSVIMLIICSAQAFGFYMAWEQIPTRVSSSLMAITENPILMLVIINILLLLVGAILEGSAALIILTPLLVPLLTSLGVDPVHFGILMVLNLTVAGVTPPIGTLMFTTCSIARVSVTDFTRKAVPLYVAMIAALMLVTYFPILSLWLPNLIYGI